MFYILYLLWYERLIHKNVLSCPLSLFRAVDWILHITHFVVCTHFLDHVMMLCS